MGKGQGHPVPGLNVGQGVDMACPKLLLEVLRHSQPRFQLGAAMFPQLYSKAYNVSWRHKGVAYTMLPGACVLANL